MKKLIMIFAAGALLATAEVNTYTGVITDDMCKLDHKHMNAGPDVDCVAACVKTSGGKVKYVLYDGKTMYKLSDQQPPEKFAGKRARVTGELFAKTAIIKVEKIEQAR